MLFCRDDVGRRPDFRSVRRRTDRASVLQLSGIRLPPTRALSQRPSIGVTVTAARSQEFDNVVRSATVFTENTDVDEELELAEGESVRLNGAVGTGRLSPWVVLRVTVLR